MAKRREKKSCGGRALSSIRKLTDCPESVPGGCRATTSRNGVFGLETQKHTRERNRARSNVCYTCRYQFRHRRDAKPCVSHFYLRAETGQQAIRVPDNRGPLFRQVVPYALPRPHHNISGRGTASTGGDRGAANIGRSEDRRSRQFLNEDASDTSAVHSSSPPVNGRLHWAVS